MRKGTGGDARRPLFSLLCTRWFMVWPRAETGSHIDAKGYRQAHTLPAPLSAVQVLAGDAAAAVFSMANSNHVIRHCTLEQQCRCICNVRACWNDSHSPSSMSSVGSVINSLLTKVVINMLLTDSKTQAMFGIRCY